MNMRGTEEQTLLPRNTAQERDLPNERPDLAATRVLPAERFTAPARVNLLGEHTDYTGGFVLPMAIPFYTQATIGASQDGEYHFVSESFPERRQMAANDMSGAAKNWSDYPVGVLRQLQERGVYPPGFVLTIGGNIPLGAGLSSSASVEVATALALLSVAEESMRGEEIALLCQRAENVYVQSPCGIMDQFAVTLAKAGHALMLHTRTLKYELIPVDRGQMGETCIVVCNSMVRHSIASGDYGLRRRELEAGQRVIIDRFPELEDLGEAGLEHLEACKGEMSHESYLRCRHIITENARVLRAKEAMLAGDRVSLGAVMLEAHASQRDQFECSCEEIDFLVDTASSLRGCFGARMTGGGFGGCTVNLVTKAEAESFSARLKEIYHERFGMTAEIYICEAVDGAIARNPSTQMQEAGR